MGDPTDHASAGPPAPGAPERVAVWVGLLCDLVVVTLFVVIGRRSHDESGGLHGLLRVWWPFAAGLVVSGACSGAWRLPFRWVRVGALCLGTVAVGMMLRIAFQGRDLAPSFVVVTTIFFALGMFGWRVLARWGMARRVPNR